MKKIIFINLAIIASLIVSSCSTSNSVVSNRLISKRKYTKGYHFNKKANYKVSEEESVAVLDETEDETTNHIASNPNYSITPEATTSDNVIQDEALNTVENSNSKEEATSAVEHKASKSTNATQALTLSKEDVKSNVSAIRKVVKESKKADLKKESSSSSSGSSDAKFILAVILCFLFPALAVLVYTYPSIDWIKVLIAFLLTLLFWIPGIIYALLVVFDVI